MRPGIKDHHDTALSASRRTAKCKDCPVMVPTVGGRIRCLDCDDKNRIAMRRARYAAKKLEGQNATG